MATTNAPQSLAYETFAGASPVSGAAPSVSTDGQPISDLEALSVTVWAANGVTLSGAGTLLAWCYDPDVGVWSRCPSADLSVATAGSQALTFSPFSVVTPRNGRVKWVPSGVTFSSGSAGVTVTQAGFIRKQRGLYK